MNKYDVIIIGGGPAGSIAARTLANAGAKVLLIEKNLRHDKPCGGTTPSVSFEEFDLPRNEIVKRINTVSVISPKGNRIDASTKNGYIAMVERGSFDSSLRRQALESRASLIEAEFSGIEERDGKIFAKVMNAGKEKVFASDFLIAADGINSRAAASMRLKSLSGIYTIQEEIDIKYAGNYSNLNSCEFWFGSSHAPRFYSWIFPKNGHIDIGTGSSDGKALKGLMKNFKFRAGINSNGRQRYAPSGAYQRVYRVPLRQREPMVIGHILFVGDAAGLVMPMNYEGIYYAMRSGKMAAEAILSGKPKNYEKEWKRKFGRQFNFMRRLQKYFLRNDRAIEILIKIHEREEVQNASMRLWLEKDIGISSFLSYISFFRKFLR